MLNTVVLFCQDPDNYRVVVLNSTSTCHKSLLDQSRWREKQQTDSSLPQVSKQEKDYRISNLY